MSPKVAVAVTLLGMGAWAAIRPDGGPHGSLDRFQSRRRRINRSLTLRADGLPGA